MIEIYNAGEYRDVVKRTAEGVLKHFGISPKTVDVETEFLSGEEMQELNREERKADAVTDVLSFPNLTDITFPFKAGRYPNDVNPETGAVILGEIFICTDRMKEQALEYGHAEIREAAFLTAHGMLHLLGFDHTEEAEAAKMEEKQEEILSSLGIGRDVANDADFSNPTRMGHVALLGRPNAGKSTLLNALVGEKVAITSWKPQTTRNRILGIYHTEDVQIAFVDTPGLHAPRNALGIFMMRSVTSALDGVETVLYVADSEKGLLDEDGDNIRRYLTEAEKNVVVAVNKIDRVTKEKVGEILSKLTAIEGLSAVVPVSAIRKKNLGPLLEELEKLCPEGEKEYGEEEYTDRSMRFMTAETIREKALRLLDKEIPYGIAVNVNRYEYAENGVLQIDADVVVQKQAHKPIVLGKGGEMIKKISTFARQDLEEMTGDKIYLTLWVRVKENWRDDMGMLTELGYTKDDYK